MATYKVPQDVEADDKLIGPFSFRQFVYLIIVALSGVAAWGLAQLFIGLAVIPLPLIIFFGALALPLRKDQPMEIYMAAMVSFYLKPRRRLWDPEGVETLIEVVAPKSTEPVLTKALSQDEAEQRLSYLANIVDSGGWAIRGVPGAPSVSMNNDIILEAQSAPDILDTNTSVAHGFDQLMHASAERRREEAVQRMMQAGQQPEPQAAPQTIVTQPEVQLQQTPVPQPAIQPTPQPVLHSAETQSLYSPQQSVNPYQGQEVSQQTDNLSAYNQSNYSDASLVTPKFDPYPNFRQSVIQPLGGDAHHAKVDVETIKDDITPETPVTTSSTPVSAGIINLANNPDLSIETIAGEAKRLKDIAEAESNEVVISLR